MFNAKLTRFASLLLAFGLLLGLAVTGCSDKDRDNLKEPVKMKTMTYSFDLLDCNKGVLETAEYLHIVAIDADQQQVTANLAETEIAKMKLDGGSYVAKAEYAENADSVVYTFYHMDGDQKVADCNRKIGVANLADGAEVEENEDQALVLSYEILDVQDPSAQVCELAVGDDLYVRVFIGKDDDKENVSDIEGLKIVTDNSEVVDLVDYSAEREAVQFKAVSEGTANLTLQVDGIKILDIVAVNVKPAVLELYILRTELFDIDDEGYIYTDGGLIDSKEELIDTCSYGIPCGIVEQEEYHLVCFVGCDERGKPLFSEYNVPAEDDVTIETVVTGGSEDHFVVTYTQGVLTLDISDATVDGEYVTLTVDAPGYECQAPITIAFEDF